MFPLGKQRRLHGDGARRIEAAHVAPRHGVLIRRRIQKDPAGAGRRIEIREERRDARRAGEQARDVALGARLVGLFERDVAVGIDERGRLRLAVERKRRTARALGALSSSSSVRRVPSVARKFPSMRVTL